MFGPLAGAGTGNGITCSNTYCHGGGTSPLTGGSKTSPVWIQVDGSQRQCGSCHGAPPPPPHPVGDNCGACHQTMTSGGGLTIAYPSLHIDGKVDVNSDQPCDSCHGSNGNAAPPRDTTGGTSTDLRTVGAHRNHLEPSTWRKTFTCDQCHRVPGAVTAIGHIDSPAPAELTFGPLAGGAVWTGARCTNTYCHGATLTGGTQTDPLWTVVNGVQGQCGSCHHTMEPGGGVVITDPQRHLDGILDVNTDRPCNDCHGSTTSNAPPKDTLGNTAPTARGVGAHQRHLATTDRFKPIECADCHVVPGAVVQAEVRYSPLNPAATYTFGTSTCSNLYCHGNGQTSTGTATWTSTTPLTCQSCHLTPAVGQTATAMSGEHDRHIRDKQILCTECHATVVNATPAIIGPALHVNGTKNVVFSAVGTWTPATKTCSGLGGACHGTETW